MTQETVRELERRIDDKGQMAALREYNRKRALKKANRKPLFQRIKKAFQGFTR